VPEETLTHSHLSWSSAILYQFPAFTMIHSLLSVQVVFLAVFLHDFCPRDCPPHPIIVFFSQQCPSHHTCFAVVPRLCYLFLVSQLFTWNSVFYLNVTHPFSTLPAEVPPHFLFLWPGLTSIWHTTSQEMAVYSLPLIFNDTSILVSSGTNCLNLFQPLWILASTAAPASQSTLNMSPE